MTSSSDQRLSNADITLAERLLRQVNGGREPYAASVLPAARLLVTYREELLASIAQALAPGDLEPLLAATDAEILEYTRELVAKLRGRKG